MSNLDKKLGRKIARQRKAVGLTQAQLAERVDVQPETISRIETGSRTSSLDLLERVSRALELEMHELFRLGHRDDLKSHAVERLLLFASRLSLTEIEFIMDIGAIVAKHFRSLKRD